MRILVCDDDAAHRLLLRRALRGLTSTHEIVEVASVQRLLETLRDTPPFDVCIVDVHLDSAWGPDVSPSLRNHSPEAFLFFVSTSDLESDIQACYRAGGDAYVVKGSALQSDILSAVKFAARSLGNTGEK